MAKRIQDYETVAEKEQEMFRRGLLKGQSGGAMTTQEIAGELCKGEKGLKQVGIAQMCEIVKVLKKKLKNPARGMRLLKALLPVLALVVLSGCSLFSEDRMAMIADKIELAVGTLGAGDWRVEGMLMKDGKAYGKASIGWTCRLGSDGKLAGCSEPTVAFYPGAQ